VQIAAALPTSALPRKWGTIGGVFRTAAEPVIGRRFAPTRWRLPE